MMISQLNQSFLAWVVAALAVAAVLPTISAVPLDRAIWARYRAPRIGVQGSVKEAAVYQGRTVQGPSFPLDSPDVVHTPLRRIDLPDEVDAFVALEYHVSRAETKFSQLRRRSTPNQVPLDEAAGLRRSTISDLDAPPPPIKRKLDLPHGRIGAELSSSVPEDALTPDRNLAAVPKQEKNLGGLPPLFSDFSGSIVTTTAGSTAPSSMASTQATATAKTKEVFPTVSVSSSSAVSAAARASAVSQERHWAGDQQSVSSVSGFSPLDLAAAQAGNLTSANDPKAPDSLPLSIEGNDVGYVTEVQFGSSHKTFRLLIDSGSADTWIPGGKCTDCGDGHARLTNKDSKTLKHHPDQAVSVRYGTGRMSGDVASDTLTIAGMSVHNFTFALANQTSQEFSDSSVPFDGLMGLAKQVLCSYNGPTPIDALHSEGLIKQPVIGYRLGRISDGHKNNDGVVSFGGVDGSSISGAVVEVPNVSQSGFWETKLDAITVNGTDLHLENRTAILDTGTSLLILPNADARAYHAAIPGSAPDGQGGWTVPCTTSASLALTVGGTSFAIDPRDLTWLPVNKDDLSGQCVSAISGGGSDKQWLVGATFLKNVYFATNAAKNTIGLAHLA